MEKLKTILENDILVYSIFSGLLFLLAIVQSFMLFSTPTAMRYFAIGATISAAFIAAGNAAFHFFGFFEKEVKVIETKKEEIPVIETNLKSNEIDKLDALEKLLSKGGK